MAVSRAENIARQRVLRLEKAKINNQAAKTFRHALAEIKESKLSTAQKSELRQAAAEVFLQSKLTTIGEINRAYKAAVSESKIGRIAEGTPLTMNEKARFADATANQKTSILASHHLSSDQIKTVLDWAYETNQGSPEDATAAFYNALEDLVETAYDTPGGLDKALNDIIIDLYD